MTIFLGEPMFRVVGATPDLSLWEQLLQADWFWGAVAAMAAVAALVGSLTTVIVAAISKHRNRSEPDWSIVLVGTAREPGKGAAKGGYSLKGKLMNVGDGVAHNVRFSATDPAQLRVQNDSFSGAMHPLIRQGETVDIAISISLGDWAQALFTLEWTDPPTRLKKNRSFNFHAGDYMERPGYQSMDPKTGQITQTHFEEP